MPTVEVNKRIKEALQQSIDEVFANFERYQGVRLVAEVEELKKKIANFGSSVDLPLDANTERRIKELCLKLARDAHDDFQQQLNNSPSIALFSEEYIIRTVENIRALYEKTGLLASGEIVEITHSEMALAALAVLKDFRKTTLAYPLEAVDKKVDCIIHLLQMAGHNITDKVANFIQIARVRNAIRALTAFEKILAPDNADLVREYVIDIRSQFIRAGVIATNSSVPASDSEPQLPSKIERRLAAAERAAMKLAQH